MSRVPENRFACLLLTFALLAGLAGTHKLAAQAPTAAIQGTVTDASGSAVVGAKVDVTNVDTSVTQTVTSDNQGRYSAPTLPIGNYDVQATATGFQTVVHKGIILSVGNQSVVDFSLPVGQSQQTVTVTGEVSQVETTTSTVSSLVDQTQMRELPLNGRNFEQLILLAPGVQQYIGQTSNAFWGKATTYSISGSRAEGQALLMDNQDMQNFWGHGTGAPSAGTSLGVDAIAEFQTLTGVYNAQFGGAGAVMNSVSKSGTNSVHGSGYEFIRNSDLDARNFFDKAAVPPFRKNQFGGTVGGPVKKDKAFFFVNYEGVRQLLSETKVADVPDANAHAGYLPCANAKDLVCNTATGLANVGIAPGAAPTMAAFPIPPTELSGGVGAIIENANQIISENYMLARFDYTLSAKDSLFVRYVLDFANQTEPFPTSPLPFWHEADTTRNQYGTIEERRIVSSNLVNSVRFTFSRPVSTGTTITSNPGFDFFPGSGRQDGAITVSGLSSTGPTSQAPFGLFENKFGESDDVILTKGAHSLKFGFTILRDDLNSLNFFREGGAWTFNSLELFMQGSATLLNGVLPGISYGNRDLRETQYMPYVHDEWRATPTLTVNAGVRYEFVTNPTDAHNQLNEIVAPPLGTGFTHVSHVFQSGNPSNMNFDPRVGLAYDPFKDHKTSFRAGFGLYHDLIDFHTYMPSLWSSPPEYSAAQTNPTFPIPFSAVTPSGIQDSPGFDYRNHTTPYMIQWNANVQREVAANTVLTVGYTGSAGVHLFNPIQQNPAVPFTNANGQLQFATLVNGKIIDNPPVNPIYGSLSDIVTNGNSAYHGLTGSLNRRFATNATVQVSYTWSHCIDDGSAFTGAEGSNNGGNANPFNLKTDRGNCEFDIRHALRVNGLYNLPFHGNKAIEGWQVSGIFTVTTGLPISPLDGFDNVGLQGTSGARPNVVPNCPKLIEGRPTQWFNPACFALQPVGTLGDSGRTNVPGPGLVNTDISLLKDTRIPKISEAFDVQFRAEFFNVFNHANFALPAANVFVSGGSFNPTAGQITATVGTSRQIQFGVKILF
jgi:hypothetical protein